MEVWDIITVIIKVVSTASMLQDHVCQMYEHGSPDVPADDELQRPGQTCALQKGCSCFELRDGSSS